MYLSYICIGENTVSWLCVSAYAPAVALFSHGIDALPGVEQLETPKQNIGVNLLCVYAQCIADHVAVRGNSFARTFTMTGISSTMPRCRFLGGLWTAVLSKNRLCAQGKRASKRPYTGNRRWSAPVSIYSVRNKDIPAMKAKAGRDTRVAPLHASKKTTTWRPSTISCTRGKPLIDCTLRCHGKRCPYGLAPS